VGVELDHVVLEGARVALREVGGCMQSTWPAYLADADAIVVRALLIARARVPPSPLHRRRILASS
jgi:hypothetical protein